jgi:hypothetical protein
LYSKFVLFAALTALIAACGGCWEKIEYTGPRTTSSSSPVRQSLPPSDASNAPDGSPTADVPFAADPVFDSAEPPTLPPTAPAEAPSQTVDDRYATPPAADPLPSDPPPGIVSPAEAPASTTSMTPAATDPPRHADATTASATVENAPSAPVLNSRRAAWLLGNRLSLAALANDRGVATANVPVWLEDARTVAKFLGTRFADLPEPAAPGDGASASRQVVNYLLVHGQQIGRELAKQHSAEESALFEIALKSNILLLLYTPGTSAGNSIAVAISQAAPQANLPAELWQPLVDALNEQATQADVRAAVGKMHLDVDQYLSQPVEPKGR